MYSHFWNLVAIFLSPLAGLATRIPCYVIGHWLVPGSDLQSIWVKNYVTLLWSNSYFLDITMYLDNIDVECNLEA